MSEGDKRAEGKPDSSHQKDILAQRLSWLLLAAFCCASFPHHLSLTHHHPPRVSPLRSRVRDTVPEALSSYPA